MFKSPTTAAEFVSWLNQNITYLRQLGEQPDFPRHGGTLYLEAVSAARHHARRLCSPGTSLLLGSHLQAEGDAPCWDAVILLERLKDNLTGQSNKRNEARDQQSPSEPPPISYLGNRTYRIGKDSFVVSVREDTVLQAFVGRPALDAKELGEKSGYLDDAPGILRKLCKRKLVLAPAITLPGKKGAGGYRAQVIDLSDA